MKINLSPIGALKTTEVSLNGLILTIDGTPYDLSVIPVGGQAQAELPFIGNVTHDEVTIQYSYDSSKAELMQSTDQADYTIDLVDGVMPSPIKWRA